MLSCSRSFPGNLRPCLTDAKGAKGANWDIILTCSEGFLSSLQPDSFGAKGADVKSACTESAATVKYSKTHLQSFSILKVGHAGLEI